MSDLRKYREKRDFDKTPEPKGGKTKSAFPLFVIQKHDASHLHYDFRLEIGGTLVSWAVPKGMPKTFSNRRLAVNTENHPLAYADFEGTIPEGEYGAGEVEIYDRGTYINLSEKTMKKCLKEGKITIELKGKKMKGNYALIHMKEKNWLLIKMKK